MLKAPPMQRKLLVATTNPGKIRELRDLLAPLGLSVVSFADEGMSPPPPVEETEQSFEGNARLKAAAYADFYKLPALADDSGLAVDFLGGAPGVQSARYSGPEASDASNVRKLLSELGSISESERKARFVCVLCLALPGGQQWQFRGECRGKIAPEPAGEGGFGYDPVFICDELPGRTFAQITPEEKASVSHRGRAVQELVRRLETGLLDEIFAG